MFLMQSQMDELITNMTVIKNIDNNAFKCDDEIHEQQISDVRKCNSIELAYLLNNYASHGLTKDIFASLNVIENVNVNKIKNKKANDIIKANMERKKIEKTNDVLASMKLIITTIDNMNDIRIENIENIVSQYDTNYVNIIAMLICLKTLISKYTNSGNNDLKYLILELKDVLEYSYKLSYNELNSTNVMGTDTNVANTEVAEVAGSANKKRNYRQERMNRSTNEQDTFDFLTLNEIMNEEMSDRIRKSIKINVERAKVIVNGINSVKYYMLDNAHRIGDNADWKKKTKMVHSWQHECVQYINNKISCLIIAPTSSGKTLLAYYCGLVNNKTLFVVPTYILALQIAGSYYRENIKTAIITDRETYGDVGDAQIVIGTPMAIENTILMMNIEFDYVIFDEIQEINTKVNGRCIERLMKTINCPMLVLSATIQNKDVMHRYMCDITRMDVKLIEYKRRPIVMQKMLGCELNQLVPISSLTVDIISKDGLNKGDIALTAKDMYTLGVQLSNEFSEYADINGMNPDLFFGNRYITLDMLDEYNGKLKTMLRDLAMYQTEDLDIFLSKYRMEENRIGSFSEYIDCIVKLLSNLKNGNKLPALIYMTDDVYMMKIYMDLIKMYDDMESKYFPWYINFYSEIANEVKKYADDEEIRRAAIKPNGRGNGKRYVDNKINEQNRIFMMEILDKIKTMYQNKALELNKTTLYTSVEIDTIKQFLNDDYNKKSREYMCNDGEYKLPEINPYAPISLFTLHKNALSMQDMKKIRNKINSNIDIKINYRNSMLKGIERGIIIYSEIFPRGYLDVLFELISNKIIPVCLCSSLLIYGINMPFRTVVIIGKYGNQIEKIDVMTAQQVQGRCGRLGYDKEGYVVYMQVNYKNIMLGTFTPLVGNRCITSDYTFLILKVNDLIDDRRYITNIGSKNLYHYENNLDYSFENFIQRYNDLYLDDDSLTCDKNISLLLWFFRENSGCDNLLILLDTLYKTYDKKLEIDSKQRYIMSVENVNGVIEMICRTLFYETNTRSIVGCNNVILNAIDWPIDLNCSKDINDMLRAIYYDDYEHDEFNVAKLNKLFDKLAYSCMMLYNICIFMKMRNVVKIVDMAVNRIIKFSKNLKLLF